MKRLTAAIIVMLLSATAYAEITVSEAWVRLLPPGVKTTAAYMNISSDQADELLSATSEASERVEIHETSMENGMMSMSEVTGIPVKPGAVLELKPGSYHLMLRQLKSPLQEGQTLDINLTFKNQGNVKVAATVEKR